jgi:hypothetical protein
LESLCWELGPLCWELASLCWELRSSVGWTLHGTTTYQGLSATGWSRPLDAAFR